jgi:glycosyltransferase involved in cell wall biosynthesis
MTMIVPCYNEAKRFDLKYWEYVVGATKDIKWIFVDDGSSDNTSELLSEIPSEVEVRRLSNNLGKAEALRWGFRKAILQESEVIGYIDADQSFDKDEVVQMCKRFKQRTEWTSSNQNYIAVFMSRSSLLNDVASLGGAFRKLFGTLISKINSAIWSELPSDTQCGFKFFRIIINLGYIFFTFNTLEWFKPI